MRKLISVHKTPLWDRIAALPVLFIMLSVAMSLLPDALSPICGVIGIVYGAYTLLILGVPFWPAHRLEIYEEGIVYRWRWRRSSWSWSEFDGISNTDNARNGPKLWIRDTAVLNLQRIDLLPDAKRLVIEHAGPVIYEKATSILERGDYIWLTSDFCIGANDLIYKGQHINWRDVEFVFLEGTHITITSPQIDNWRHRISFNPNKIRNGIVYARLVRNLWQQTLNEKSFSDVDSIVVGGVLFSSEGEFIKYDADE
ncbi:MAG: hypothetical protein L0154_19915 [Chloroflexi bacterium]|nr:hypothetical protein [Chloroflexota bacterium]